MKLIPYVNDAMVTDLHREPVIARVKQPDGSVKEEQMKLSQRELFIQRLEDPMLVQGKPPLKASKFVNKIYDAIMAQSDDEVKRRGGWKFEDEHADALCKVVKEGPSPTRENPLGGYPMFALHVIGDMLEAVESQNVKEWKDPTQEEAKPNGVADKASSEATAQA